MATPTSSVIPPKSPTFKRNKTSTGSGFLDRRISGLSFSRRGTSDESSEDIRGPFGLNLLHEPSEPLIDFIFVHGLRGGSRKTWSKSENIEHFWPKEWLPADPKFKNVRIHSFGYNSNWGERSASVLTIHDFGQALLGDIHTSPSLNEMGMNHHTPLVLVGHSMGGVVIKKALLIAKLDPQYHTIANRIHTMYFLATPHRGADSAQLLRNMIKLSFAHNSKAYVSDLIPNSGAIQVINDEFRHVYHSVQLWSFFETQPSSLGMIVEKDSAIIGLPGERIQLLNADHRHVCKFEDPSDNNYRTLRNAFASTIDGISNTQLASKMDAQRSFMRSLSQYLGVMGKPDADLNSILEKKFNGSCLWINDRMLFQDWVEEFDDSPRCYWLRGEPATGKSTIAAHVVDCLEHLNRECSYFFFKYGDATRSTVASLLLSLAWQMASVNSDIRQELIGMHVDGEIFDNGDERSIWTKMFVSRIFNAKLKRTHYWIVDALDECTNTSILFPFLSRIPKSFPLRVFMTSRPSLAIERLFSQEKVPQTAEDIEREASLGDIKLFLDGHSQYLPVEDEEDRQDLIDHILERSNGNFLWASLTLKELEESHSDQQVLEVLDSVPTEMDALYARILDRLVATARSVELAKAILTWTVCATRPLLVEELKEAIRIDIHETIHNLEKTAGSICGNLVYVDKQQRVQIAHQTVRAYLVRDGLSSDFAVVRPQAHSRIAEVCLKYLCGDEMKTSRHRRGSASAGPKNRSLFADYASVQFSEHIARSSSSIDAPFIALNSFLRSNALTWIELIATSRDLNTLIQTGKNLKTYLARRAKYRSPLGLEVSNVSAWASDLIHLVAQFGKALLVMPSSIQFLVPSVCPSESIIYKTFKDYPRNLQLVGLSQTDWNDQISCIIYPKTQAYTLACSDNRFAIGLSDGSIRLYNETTCQEELKLIHGEPVRHLVVTNTNTHLAAAGRKKITMWDISTETLLWTATAPDIILSIEFNDICTSLMTTIRSEYMIFWRVDNGKEEDRCHFEDIFEEVHSSDGEQKQRPTKLAANYRRPPNLTIFSTEMNLLAIGYRARPVGFWNLEDSSYVGQFWRNSDEFQPAVVALVFNPNLELNLVAAAYQDGTILVFDPWTQEKYADSGLVSSAVLASSPDGTILASGDHSGVITLFDFETLRPIYRVTSLEHNIRHISFSSTGLRFYDIRNDRCSVWEPSVLVRRNDEADDSSFGFSEELPMAPEVTTNRIFEDDLAITTIVAHQSGNFVFCGRENGSVAAYICKTGQPLQELFSHGKNVAILQLEWKEASTALASVDRSGHVIVHTLTLQAPGRLEISEPVLNKKSAHPVHQILLSSSGKHLLVSTAESDDVWDLETASLVHTNMPSGPRAGWKWGNHPTQISQLLLVNGGRASIFHWANFHELSKTDGIDLGLLVPSKVSIVDIVLSSRSRNICLSQSGSRSSSGGSAPSLRFWPAKLLTPNTEQILCIADYDDVASAIKVIIGVFRSLLVFLDHDSWVCSIDINTVDPAEKAFTRHFFIPFQLQGSAGQLITLVTSRGAVVLVAGDEIAVFHGGLEFEEKVGTGDGKTIASNRPSMRGKRFSSAPT